MKSKTKLATAGVAALALVTAVPLAASSSRAFADGHDQTKHVLLISVDGMHQSDLDWYVANHPNSELARLATGGAEYTDAQTPDPSDSDPGGTGLMTGADPKTLGIYYDDEYSHGVFPPGTTNCSGAVPGGDVIYDSPDDNLPAVADLLNNGSGNTFPSFDEGGSIYPGGLDANPGSIMDLSPQPQSGLNPATYPVDPKTCQPIQPWDFLGVNTIFQVIHNSGMRTAWSDKHAVYTSYNGPGSGGSSINDFFGPEIDSQAVEPNGVPYPVDGAWTADNATTRQYDSYKVQAVINWINGYDHSGTGPKVGTPAIYGMNFQTVSTAEKLKSSPAVLIGPDAQGKYTEGPSLPGGYVTVDGQQVPGPLLQSALGYVNNALERMADTIQANGLADSTAIILTAKHGQSPLTTTSCSGSTTVRSLPASTPPGPHSIRAPRRWSSKRLTTTGFCGGCRTAPRRRLTSSRTTCGRIPPRRSTTPATPSPSSTPACRRSSPASSRRNSSASRAPTPTTRTCSGSPRSARSIRPAQRSPSTAAPTRVIGTFRSSSMRRAPSGLATQATGWRRPRSLPRS
jgi:hypothetical protein